MLAGCAMGGPGSLDDVDEEGLGGAGGLELGGGAGQSSSGETGSGDEGGAPGAGGEAPEGCGGGELKCGGICIDVLSDPSHCGGCTTVCAEGQPCVAGICDSGSGSSSSSSSSSSGGGGSCHPLSPEAVCGPGVHCEPQVNGAAECAGPLGSGEQYAYCTTSADCALGLSCVTQQGPYSFCMQWCTSSADCDNYYDDCTATSPALFIGSQPWGVCYNGVV